MEMVVESLLFIRHINYLHTEGCNLIPMHDDVKVLTNEN